MARHPERYEVFALTAHSRVDELLAQCRQWRPRYRRAARRGAGARAARRAAWRRAAHRGACWRRGALRGGRACRRSMSVMAAIVGAAGLAPCLAAARAGKRLLLANKEALVVGGALFMQAVREGGAHAAADRQRALGDLPVPARGPRALGRSASTTSCSPRRAGRSAARPGDAARRDARRGLRPPELGDGAQDLGRLGDDDEQGAGGDRGALAVRPGARADPGRDPSAEHHALDGRVPRQLGAGAARHARHARADRLRPVVARAHRVGRRAARLRGRWQR